MIRRSLDTIRELQDGNFEQFQSPTTKIQVGAAPNDNYFWNAGHMGFHLR